MATRDRNNRSIESELVSKSFYSKLCFCSNVVYAPVRKVTSVLQGICFHFGVTNLVIDLGLILIFFRFLLLQDDDVNILGGNKVSVVFILGNFHIQRNLG